MGPAPKRSARRERTAANQRARIWGSALIALVVIAVLMVLNIPGSSKPKHHASTAVRQPDPRTTKEHASTTAAATGDSTAGSRAAGSNPYAKYETRTLGDPEALGRVNAPVVIVEWADYQCPFCGKFTRNTLPVLIRKYVDTGEVRFEWRDFPYFGPQSTTSAIAARAAGLQGKFWAYHDALYAHQESPNSGYLNTAYLLKLARQIHLNIPKFRADLDDHELSEQVQSEYTQGQNLGIMGTPAFIIGDQPVEGAQPLSVFEKVIGQQLARAKR